MAVDVLCIGHAAFDNSLFLDGFPRENQKLEIADLCSGGGGPAANAACLLGRWGVACAFAGVVGDDRYGQQLRAEFESAGVETSCLEVRPGHVTPVSTILVNTRNGSRTIINRKAATAPLALPPGALARLAPRVILADGHELPAALAALEAWPQALSILDAGSQREGTLGLAGAVTALVASERFALQVTGRGDLQSEGAQRDALRVLQERFAPRVVVVTLGERGLIADWGEGFHSRPAEAVVAVDTTGAGDIFHGAVAYGALQGWAWPAILDLASRAAALSVTRRGGRQSIPRLAEALPAE
jgi:sugar/nucleoside kinase (ribokinase family)